MKKIGIILLLGLFTGCTAHHETKNTAVPASSIESSSTIETEEQGIIYDVEDSEIIEHIINTVLNNQDKKREELDISIYTHDNSFQRNIWVAHAVFSDNTTAYLLYIKEAGKLVEIDKNEFDGKVTSIQKRNHSDTAIYKEKNNE
ncbi:hypothetical protein [Enterococcus sp. LJL51]|uniref:hypothetical protein n=1 Tax=Enterococcus sp. LJL51 TaxID=3416656 RepID=UPI003CF98E57